jgi:peptidoglycan/LPS O-acetylase OafA/YrhL
VFRLSLLADHFPALHGLRVLAILSVLQFHVTTVLRQAGLLEAGGFTAASLNVFFGMDLFFIMSGFLIGSILLHNDHRDGGLRATARFYVRRLFRTVPLYWIFLGGLLLIFPFGAARLEHLARDFFYLTNYGHDIKRTSIAYWGWSLCVEEHFYLAVPLFVALLRIVRSRRAVLTILGALWVAGGALRLGLFLEQRGTWTQAALFEQIYIRTHARLDILIAGIFLAYLHRHFAGELGRLFARPAVRLGTYGFAALCLVPLLHPQLLGAANGPLVRVIGWGTITSLMYVPLILAMIHGADRFQRLLGAPLLRRIATLGYGMYLVHIPVCVPLVRLVRHLAAGSDLPAWILWPGMLAALVAASLAVAWVLHLLVEKPMLVLRDRLTR